MKTNKLSIYMLSPTCDVIVDGKNTPIANVPTSSPLMYETPNRSYALQLAIRDIANAYHITPSKVAIRENDMLKIID